MHRDFKIWQIPVWIREPSQFIIFILKQILFFNEFDADCMNFCFKHFQLILRYKMNPVSMQNLNIKSRYCKLYHSLGCWNYDDRLFIIILRFPSAQESPNNL